MAPVDRHRLWVADRHEAALQDLDPQAEVRRPSQLDVEPSHRIADSLRHHRPDVDRVALEHELERQRLVTVADRVEVAMRRVLAILDQAGVAGDDPDSTPGRPRRLEAGDLALEVAAAGEGRRRQGRRSVRQWPRPEHDCGRPPVRTAPGCGAPEPSAPPPPGSTTCRRWIHRRPPRLPSRHRSGHGPSATSRAGTRPRRVLG